MKDSGKMIKQMVMDLIFIPMGQIILGNGRMINNMVMEFRNGLMEKNMKDIMRRESKQEKEC